MSASVLAFASQVVAPVYPNLREATSEVRFGHEQTCPVPAFEVASAQTQDIGYRDHRLTLQSALCVPAPGSR